ncbi:MAG TPA: hypothetical protein VKB25_05915 [Conexibacter sp.]|nr:hypothetical protein [Conexibacter sp.]
MRAAVLASLVGLLVLWGGTASAAQVQLCEVVAFERDSAYTDYASLLAAGTGCAEATAVVEAWYAELDGGRLPDVVINGGHARFGADWMIGEYSCRYRRLGSDIGEAWCRAPGDRVVGWGRHRGFTGEPERPTYPKAAPRGWEVEPAAIRMPRLSGPAALRYLRQALTGGFWDSYTHAYGRTANCRRVSRIRFRCRPSWIIGDVVFHGTAWIWHVRDLASISWHYAWRITQTDEYCVYTGGRNCHRVFRVR